MILESIFKKTDFVNRYQKICADHRDFENGLRGNNSKMYLKMLRLIDDSVIYHAKDRMFQIDFKYQQIALNLGLKLHNGLVDARLFYIDNNEWLINNRFDFIAEKLKEGFRNNFTIPSYTSEDELEIVLKELFIIYEDLKAEVIKLQA